MFFDVQVSQVEGIEVVSVVGDVDMSTLPALSSAVARLDGASRAINLSSVHYFDPVCLGVLVAANLRAIDQGAQLLVVAAERTRKLLERSGLAGVLEVVDALPAGPNT
jgi:anti-anti-sigma factor